MFKLVNGIIAQYDYDSTTLYLATQITSEYSTI